MQGEGLLGYRPDGSGSDRACDIDDIPVAFLRLRHSGKINEYEARTLLVYGVKQVVPDRRVDPRGLQAWSCALDRLYTLLVKKGIVERRR